jgi:hypothetical protein
LSYQISGNPLVGRNNAIMAGQVKSNPAVTGKDGKPRSFAQGVEGHCRVYRIAAGRSGAEEVSRKTSAASIPSQGNRKKAARMSGFFVLQCGSVAAAGHQAALLHGVGQRFQHGHESSQPMQASVTDWP